MATFAEQAPWKEEFINKLIEVGDLQRGQLAKIMKEIAETHDIKEKSVSNYYYREGKTLAERRIEEKRKTKAITELTESERRLVDSIRTVETRPLKPPYKIGDIVDIEITALVGYGAFCKILDCYEYPALIHIKHITGLYVSDVEEYFKVGDRLKAKVFEVKDDKISLSTKGMPLPSHMPKEYRSEFQSYSQVKNPGFVEKLTALTISEVAATQKSENPVGVTDTDSEMVDIIKFLNQVVGMVSPKAQEMAKEIIAEHGIFRFSLAMTKVAQSFENDLGVHLMKEVSKSVGDCL